jgi:hypothetical protein
MPGYDDTRTDRQDAFAVDRQGGKFYRESWSAAAASQPDWIIITSFNEWIEGTMIEPSLSYGDYYLELTRTMVRGFTPGTGEPRTDEPESRAKDHGPSSESPELGNIVQIEPYVQAEEAVRVRSGPGTDYSRVGQLWPGETASVIGQNADGSWWQIEFLEADDGLGWVIDQFVTFVGDADSVPIVGEELITPTLVPSPTATITSPGVTATTTATLERTPSPVRTPTPTQSTVFAPTLRPNATTPAPTPSDTPTVIPVPTSTPPPTPTFTLTLAVSPTASPTATSTPVLRITPVAHRRPVGLLWLGGGALIVAVALGLLLLRATREGRTS